MNSNKFSSSLNRRSILKALGLGTASGFLGIAGGIPSLTGITYSQPCQGGGCQERYYEPHGWSTDNSTVLFSGQGLSIGTFGVSNYNIYSYNPTTTILANLTNTVLNWAEYPTPLPSFYGANRLIYMLYPQSSSNASCIADYWIMNFDGTGNYQLTFFNTPGTTYYNPSQLTCMDDMSWNPNNPSQIAVYANNYAQSRYTNPANQGPIYILTLTNLLSAPQVTSIHISGGTFSGVLK